MLISSENSNFNGSFTTDFSGGNKSTFGPIDVITPVFDPAINIVKYVDKVVTESEMTHVNFDSLSAGDTVYDQLPGVVITAVNNRVPGAGNRAMVFDSSAPTGGDLDLGTPNQAFGGPGVGAGGATNTEALGNVLIISEDGDASDPDDEAHGGTFTFTFDQPISLNYLDLLDIDTNESGGSVVTVTTASGTQTFDIPTAGNNSWQRLDIDVDEVTEMTVHFVSSGAISEFKYTTTTSEKQWFDANEAPGIEFDFGETVEFSYHVTNPGDVSLAPVVVIDDNATPEVPGDDFAPIPVEVDNGSSVFFNVGDLDQDNQLDPGEEWIYTFSIIATTVGQFTNIADVTGTPIDENGEVIGEDVTDDDPANYVVLGQPGISIEKSTNGFDADTPEDAVEIVAGETVTWTYDVENTGAIAFTQSEVVVIDDNGTPDDTSDDFSPTLVASSDDGSDGILSPGETWQFSAEGTAETTGSSGDTSTLHFDGNSALSGTFGNTRDFSVDGIDVSVSAFSRDSSGVWSDAFLGIFSGGLGVTDSSEGDGTNGKHRVDNVGRTNYVVFEFSDDVIVNRALLASVVGDSDLSVWIGSVDSFSSLSDALLADLFDEVNNTTSSSSRWADFNDGDLAGNFLVLAASTADTTPDDNFKISKVQFQQFTPNVYVNIGTVTAGDVDDSDPSHYRNPVGVPGISIEKFTNGVDADTPSQAVEIAAGETVTWTYFVENTGTLPFAQSDVNVLDDNGTPGHTGDDFSPMLIESSDVGSDGILSPGETWEFFAEGVAETTGTAGATSTLYFNGNSGLDGPNGNIRSFSVDGVSVNASAFSRTTSGTWNDAFLGIFSGGLGVTDSGEGDGSNGLHRVDNVGRTNYVVLTFSDTVIVDRAFLDSVVNDSDLSIWVGNIDGAHSNGVSLSDSVLAGLTNETNNTSSSNSRWANFNGGEVAGNVLVLAASVEDTTPDDRFKIRKVEFQQFLPSVYGNVGTVNAGDVHDADLSHYRNPAAMDLMFEAEDFDDLDHPWNVYDSSDASGGQYLKVANGYGSYYNSAPTNNSVSYHFSVDQSGSYSLSGLVRTANSADNSLWVKINNGSWVQWHMDVTGSQWEWQTVTNGSNQHATNFDLDAGVNTLEIALREDGTKIDKFMISKLS